MITAEAYWGVFKALLPLVIIAGVAFGIFRKLRLAGQDTGLLKSVLVNLALPALIASQILRTFDPKTLPNWPAYPILSLIMLAASACVGAVFCIGVRRQRERIEFVGAATFQNYAFLPIAILTVLPLDAGVRGRMMNALFLFMVPNGIVLSTLGLFLISGGATRRGRLADIVSAPLVATVVCVVAVLVHKGPFARDMSDLGFATLDLLGRCVAPLAMIVTGATLACNVPTRPRRINASVRLILVTCVVIPVIALGVVRKAALCPAIASILFVQAVMPPALSLVTISRAHHWEETLTQHAVYFAYLASIFTAPFWLVYLLGGL